MVRFTDSLHYSPSDPLGYLGHDCIAVVLHHVSDHRDGNPITLELQYFLAQTLGRDLAVLLLDLYADCRVAERFSRE